VRNSLVAALAACVETSLRPRARRFLSGLSCDELEFLAGFFGGWILEANTGREARGAGKQNRTETRGASVSDLDHKLILVHEYLCCAGSPQFAARVESAR
jgi:hypothetical protein